MSLAELPWNTIIEILGFLTGLLYLWWEYHADPRMWVVGVIMPCISMWIYFSRGIYADFSINIYYFFMAIFGYIHWTRRGRNHDANPHKKKELPITHIGVRNLWLSLGASILLWALLYFILNFFTDSTVPVPDAFTTALSIVGTWMLARKYIEQWIVWILVDSVCVGLYIYKGIYFYAALYAIYTIVAVIGLRNWANLMKKSAA